MAPILGKRIRGSHSLLGGGEEAKKNLLKLIEYYKEIRRFINVIFKSRTPGSIRDIN